MGTTTSTTCLSEDVSVLSKCVAASSVDFKDFKVEDIQVYPSAQEQIAYVEVQSQTDIPQSARWKVATEGFCVAKVRPTREPVAQHDQLSQEHSYRKMHAAEGGGPSARDGQQPPPLPVLLRGSPGAGPTLFRADADKPSSRSSDEEYGDRLEKADCSTRTSAASTWSGPTSLWRSANTPSSSKADSSSGETARWRMMTVKVERDSADESLGVDVAHIEDKLLQVIGIAPKNETVAAEVFQLGDIILQVNGIKGSSDQMVRECALREDLTFRVARPEDEEAADNLIRELSKPRVPPLKLPTIGAKKPGRPNGFGFK